MTSEPVPLSAICGKEKGGGHLTLDNVTIRKTNRKASSPMLMPLACSSIPHPSLSVLLCCSGEEQSLLSRVVQLVRVRDNSPVLITPGPCFPLALDGMV